VNVLSLFDGIGSGRIALERAGIPVTNYFSVEIDKYAMYIASKNYPDIEHLGMVEKWYRWALKLPKIDLLLGGSPCQGFSRAGLRMGFNDPRSRLFFFFEAIKNELNPKYFLLENTRMNEKAKSLISLKLNTNAYEINSNLVSAQNRSRLYWTNIPFTYPEDKGIILKDIIPSIDKIYVTPRGKNSGGERPAKKCPTITTSDWQHNFYVIEKNGIKRMFTPEECEQIQTLPLGYTKGVSNTQRYKKIGNGWTIDLIAHILQGIF